MNWDEPKQPGWLNARVFAWALFDLGITIFSMIVISRYGGVWVVKELGGSVSNFNYTLSASMAVAVLFQVLLSPISDEMGRRRVFVLGFTLLCVAACALMKLAPTLAMGLLLFGVSNVGYQTAYVFYNAMLGDVADERHKARVSGIGVGLGYVGSIIGLLVSERFVNAGQHVYSPIFWVTAVLVLIFALPLFIFVKEKPSLVRLDLASSLQNSIGSFVTTIRRVMRHREILFFFLGCLLALDAVSSVIVNMALYCETVVGLDPVKGIEWSPQWKGRVLFPFTISEINLFIIVSTVFAVVGAFGIGHIADKTSRYNTLLAVLILWMAALVLAMFSVQRKLFWFTGPLFGLGFGGIWTVSRAYVLELCHPEERAQMFAFYGFVTRSSAILGPFIWATTFDLSSLIMDERKSYRMAIAAMLLLMILGFWILLKARPKTENRLLGNRYF